MNKSELKINLAAARPAFVTQKYWEKPKAENHMTNLKWSEKGGCHDCAFQNIIIEDYKVRPPKLLI